jgi:hypothetical protein
MDANIAVCIIGGTEAGLIIILFVCEYALKKIFRRGSKT